MFVIPMIITGKDYTAFHLVIISRATDNFFPFTDNDI